jgi:hypothetical protein
MTAMLEWLACMKVQRGEQVTNSNLLEIIVTVTPSEFIGPNTKLERTLFSSYSSAMAVSSLFIIAVLAAYFLS